MDSSVNPLVIAFGQFRSGERLKLTLAAQEAHMDLRFAEAPGQLEELLETEPAAVVMDAAAPTVDDAYQTVRLDPVGRRVPIIAVTTELDDLVFGQTFTAGGDDAVEFGAVRPLLLRLRMARALGRLPEPAPRGVAIIADADEDRLAVRARTLSIAGFVVRTVGTAAEALAQTRSASPSVLLVEVDLPGGPEVLLDSARSHPSVTHVLLSPPQSLVAASQTLQGLANAAAIDSFAPAESIIFLVNELQGPRMENRRKTRRVLYGTKVAFRGEGRERVDHGFNYNLSAEGLYVRTLAPPEDEHVWLELRPPRSNRWVHLEGRVVWRRPFGLAGTATVPPGFGVQLLDATPRNRSTWLDGYHGLVEGMQRDAVQS